MSKFTDIKPYEEHPDMEELKDVIDPFFKRLEGKTYKECIDIFVFLKYCLESSATLRMKPLK